MLKGVEAVQMYRKGIEVLSKDIQGYKAAGLLEDLSLT